MRALERHYTQGEQLQREVLEYLLSKAKDTEYGLKHGFGGARGYDDFAHNTPVNTYEEFLLSRQDKAGREEYEEELRELVCRKIGRAHV